MTKKIIFTEQAIEEINKIVLKNGNQTYFRVSVKGGGCSGFKYEFTFDNKVEKDDIIFNNTLIDKNSLEIIKGSTIDFKKEMIGESFVITNPKATSSCGCGLSFSI